MACLVSGTESSNSLRSASESATPCKLARSGTIRTRSAIRESKRNGGARCAASRARLRVSGENRWRVPVGAAHDAGFRPAHDYTGVALKVWRFSKLCRSQIPCPIIEATATH